MTFSFTRDYRLKSKKGIGDLFLKGIRIKEFPFTLVHTVDEDRVGLKIKIGLSVPKKLVPRAVDRIRIKRLMRESIRLNISELITTIESLDKAYNVMIIYHGNKDCSHTKVESKIILLLKRFKDQISK
ncbi:MAG: ribonuclease P protein component [Patiriisocius sp.]